MIEKLIQTFEMTTQLPVSWVNLEYISLRLI